jgi:hypothetical protein
VKKYFLFFSGVDKKNNLYSNIDIDIQPNMSSHTSATTNYAIEQPSYGYTDRTTEFDDALLQRGIVTMEQVLLAKGMSVNDAQLFLQHQNQESTNETTDKNQPSDQDDSDLDDDDAFLQEYHQRRIQELQESSCVSKQEQRSGTFGDVVTIDRTEWIRHVNNNSMDCWVVVGLLSSCDSERTAMIEKAIYELARIHVTTKFVLIPSHRAIAFWPDENLPSLFLYRHGIMQHELSRLPVQISAKQLEDKLTGLNVL